MSEDLRKKVHELFSLRVQDSPGVDHVWMSFDNENALKEEILSLISEERKNVAEAVLADVLDRVKRFSNSEEYPNTMANSLKDIHLVELRRKYKVEKKYLPKKEEG